MGGNTCAFKTAGRKIQILVSQFSRDGKEGVGRMRRRDKSAHTHTHTHKTQTARKQITSNLAHKMVHKMKYKMQHHAKKSNRLQNVITIKLMACTRAVTQVTPPPSPPHQNLQCTTLLPATKLHPAYHPTASAAAG